MKKKEFHGLTDHPLFWVFDSMKQRCYNSKDKRYKNYGGRGIKICDDWLNCFRAFYDWAISGGWELGLTIDRIENNGNYEPSNCRFVTNKVQANNKRTNRLITIDGVTKNLRAWCDELNFDYDLASNRLNQHGWPEDNIFRKEKGGHLS